jgi:tRNA modification GTPase
MINTELDTIVALATPPGTGALAIIRLSGADALAIAEKIFSGRDGIARDKAARYYGEIVQQQNGLDTGRHRIDEVILHTFIGPHSFTGEDTVEINCHGGVLVVERLLGILLQKGARLAEPGEFSKRAFLNGKIDLLQAEAIADVISAQSGQGLELSLSQLHGDLSSIIKKLGAEIRECCALLELELDFSEDIEFVDRRRLAELLGTVDKELGATLAGFRYGRMLREGATVVIAGKPNVGKSTLMNRLLRSERAIVSAIPGTTRDSLEEGLRLEGRFFKLIDTAGLRPSADEIEREGVSRSKAWLEKADIILLLFDASAPLDDNDREAAQIAQSMSLARTLYLFNKMDLVHEQIAEILPGAGLADDLVKLSCKTGDGLELLQSKLLESVNQLQPKEGAIIITRLRHYEALQRALIHLREARSSLTANYSGEFIALDLRMALDAVGEVVGKVTSSDILKDIFSSFCIGK